MSSVEEIVSYYNNFDEDARLLTKLGEVEFLRTAEILEKFIPTGVRVIVDAGGASGRYSYWLASKGHDVHLVDVVPKHIEQAIQKKNDSGLSLSSYAVSDARSLSLNDNFADIVLLMGPMYHLTEKEERIKALKESSRILKNGGLIFVAAVSRFASTIDGLVEGYCFDEQFEKIMMRDLIDGQHRNPSGNPFYFTSTFFHHPDELKHEISEAGFKVKSLLAVEGIGYMLKDFEKNWDANKELILEILRMTESEPTLIGASPHILCVAEK